MKQKSNTNSNPNNNYNVLINGGKRHTLTLENQRAGGKSTSFKKRISSRLNGLSQKKDLTEQQKHMIALIKEKRYYDVIDELIMMNLEDIDNQKRRDKVIDQLTKLLPQKNLTMNVDRKLTFQDVLKSVEKEFSNK